MSEERKSLDLRKQTSVLNVEKTHQKKKEKYEITEKEKKIAEPIDKIPTENSSDRVYDQGGDRTESCKTLSYHLGDRAYQGDRGETPADDNKENIDIQDLLNNIKQIACEEAYVAIKEFKPKIKKIVKKKLTKCILNNVFSEQNNKVKSNNISNKSPVKSLFDI